MRSKRSKTVLFFCRKLSGCGESLAPRRAEMRRPHYFEVKPRVLWQGPCFAESTVYRVILRTDFAQVATTRRADPVALEPRIVVEIQNVDGLGIPVWLPVENDSMRIRALENALLDRENMLIEERASTVQRQQRECSNLRRSIRLRMDVFLARTDDIGVEVQPFLAELDQIKAESDRLYETLFSNPDIESWRELYRRLDGLGRRLESLDGNPFPNLPEPNPSDPAVPPEPSSVWSMLGDEEDLV